MLVLRRAYSVKMPERWNSSIFHRLHEGISRYEKWIPPTRIHVTASSNDSKLAMAASNYLLHYNY